MSERLDMEAINLCIPEDAFEKFQAVSMYQEEKCILLPQKEPPIPNPESEENTSSPDINEVVVSSCNEINSIENAEGYIKQPLNSPCVVSSVCVKEGSSLINSADNTQQEEKEYNYENDLDMVVSNSENINNQGKTIKESLSTNKTVLPQKRESKRKKSSTEIEESSKGFSGNVQNPDISSTPFSSDPETIDTVIVVKKKRGRPKKSQPIKHSEMLHNVSNKDPTSDLSSSDTNRCDDFIVKKPTRTKRRSRPESANTLAIEINNDSPSSDNQTQLKLMPLDNVVSENINEVTETSKKRKQKSIVTNSEKTDGDDINVNPDYNKILSDNMSDNDDLDDVCLSKLRRVPDQLNLSNLTEDNISTEFKTDDTPKVISSVNSEEQINKSKKKRGRPKKYQGTESISQFIERSEPIADPVCLNEDAHRKDDDADDMCLSKLKAIADNATPAESTTESPNMEIQQSVDPKPETMDISVSEVPTIENQVPDFDHSNNECNETPIKRNTKMPVMADFEYNIDSVLGNENRDERTEIADNSLLVEDTSKRPNRRKIKKYRYEEESDEDPFANVELSDDEPRRGRRGNKYYSDDEYIPGKRGHDPIHTSTDTEISDNELHLKSDDTKKQRRRKLRKKSDNQSPRKRGKKDDDQKTEAAAPKQNHNIDKSTDLEVCLDSCVIKTSDGESQHSQPSQWGTTTEFENFLAKKIQGTNLKIKKVSSNVPAESNKIDIPVLDPEAKKTIEMCTQTNIVPTSSIGVQTVTPYDIPMKENVALTAAQSEKACHFLNSIVKTTAELGLLMTQKSEDFIKKKINTNHVTDTAKMDYCVKKSFLLFKLAKHNLLQMEEDLSKQYEQFLEANNLTKCREEQKEVAPSVKEANSDSDCEIVDVKPSPQPKAPQKSSTKPTFNPKTVFLNKELSIKIAKKPNENKKLDIKGRHTVWINDTVMVKKVKPTQSFLAQDSRNKKPPDNYITTKMVSDFFKDYDRQRALSACAPFVNTDWLNVYEECVCNYFVVKPLQYNTDENYSTNGFSINTNESTTTISEPSSNLSAKMRVVSSPDSLFTLCFLKLKNQLCCNGFNHVKGVNHEIRCELTDNKKVPVSLFRLCLKTINETATNSKKTNEITTICSTSSQPDLLSNDIVNTTPVINLMCHQRKVELATIPPLKSLCHRQIVALMSTPSCKTPFYRRKEDPFTVLSLKSLCHRKIVVLFGHSLSKNLKSQNKTYLEITCDLEESNKSGLMNSDEIVLQTDSTRNEIKSLFSLCVEYIQRICCIVANNHNNTLTPKCLKEIAFENVKYSLYSNDSIESHQHNEQPPMAGLMINCVNTLSEEAFLNLEQCDTDIPDSTEYLDNFETDNEESFEPDFTKAEGDTEPSWVTQVQMQELRSCVNVSNTDVDEIQEFEPIITHIKLEPLDEITDNLLDSVPVKSEPVPCPDEMTIIPNFKNEVEEHIQAGSIHRQNSSSYDGDAFEQFVSSSKLMQALSEGNTEEIYSQSSARVRKQHEPDYYEENVPDMLDLLVPHTYEPMSIQKAKGRLMDSSSDESSKNIKSNAKKVLGKRPRRRPRKSEQKLPNKEKQTPSPAPGPTIASNATPPSASITPPPTSTSAPVSSPVPTPTLTKEKAKQKGQNSEVAILTRKMKEKIRQEEKEKESSDSDNENITVRLRSREKRDTSDKTKDKTKPNSKGKINEIQCNNVDSTDQLDETLDTFTGFTSIETNEMSNYEKYMKFVYSKVIPEKEDEKQKEFESSMAANKKVKDVSSKELLDTNEKSVTSVINPNEPVELLECEPTFPILDESIIRKNVNTIIQTKTKDLVPAKAAIPTAVPTTSEVIDPASVSVAQRVEPFKERHGWHCYPLDSTDSKLYQNVCIPLEKLPESFVQTYFKYQDISSKDKSDVEIDRLTNLNSLNRPTNLKDRKPPNSSKRETKDDQHAGISEDESQTISAVDSDHFDELMPSDDECPRTENEVPPPVLRQTENTLAKNLLMKDNESDEDVGVNLTNEPVDNSFESKKARPLCKKKAAIKTEVPTDLMLTADKMMNKELTLLHAPVIMDENLKNLPNKGPVTRHNKKSGTKPSPTNNKPKTEEDSSSEEEKQWVSTKEKLLKRMGKKESTSADDAKRAKLVSEFIERREGNLSSRKTRGVRARRSGKKFLERQKQLRVLQHELFGETSTDPTVGKRSGAAWKGRRNIRKVLDKKSLARSTVIANMEEFERKRRLNARQTKLRELLGCEEGVNVLVINDEVCLEYDFEEHRPVVTIHPFFTKVMKAHQYEGVKFMWDACFESLADIEAGHAGGGCILAHCMGLGKTLQVLALLHTVLTHPRVGMQRVLVCCPLSTVLNWVDEIHKWIGPVTNQIKVFELSKLKKTYERAYQLEDWYNGGGIFIIGYELFRSLSTLDPLLDDVRPTIVNKIRTALLDPGPDIIVCDEGHLLKNDCSVLAVSMSRVVTKRRIVLTGTPMQNNLREYYCMVNFVKPNLLGTYAEYSNRFENPIMNGQHRDSREEDIKLMKARTHILHKVLEGCLQRQEVSVLYPYLPKKHEYTVFITLTKCQWDLYKHYLNHYSKQMKQNSILKDFHILQKIWSHPQVLHNFQTKVQDSKTKIKLEKLEDDLATEDQEDIKEVATELWWLQYLEGGNMLDCLEVSNKFVVVFRILDECVALGDKVLIFSTSLFCLDALEYFLKKINNWSLGQEYYRLDGSVPPEVRQKWCREFNADNNVNTKLFLISTRAGCLGLNMTAANRVIIMDTSWNPAHDIQSIFRVYRFGQKKDCYIYRLVAMGTMEQKIYERSVTKQAVACRVVDEQQIDRHYNMAELTELYRYDEAGATVAPGVAVGVCDVALLRVARETALHAVHEHDSLLRSSEQGLPEHERAAAWMQFQQEQAHKQMENKLIANIPKISLRRLQGNNYTQSFELNDIRIKTEEMNSADTSEDFVPPNEAKSKKSKKIKKLIVPVPPTTQFQVRVATRSATQTSNLEEPSTSKGQQENINKIHNDEEMMVRKITEILIKHNFHNRQVKSNISNLVAKVRQIVTQGYIHKGKKTDNLTASIAEVLLSKRISMPTLTGIMCESINNSNISEVSEEQPEEILSTPTVETKVNEVRSVESNVSDNRRKRKAAIAAEKHIDSIAQDVIINLDDELDTTDVDFVPDKISKPERPQINKKKFSKEPALITTNDDERVQRNSISSPVHLSTTDTDASTINITTPAEAVQPAISNPKPALRIKAGPKTYKKKLKEKLQQETNQDSNNLLLSDECESLGNSNEVVSNSVKTAKKDASNPPDYDEVSPLPLSLLTNKNFINIVAHTYLNGNPMLDADAATLAAQYSTYKSLKEAEETGKDITSGPIYDIAVKVLGKALFKKMHSANAKTNSPSVEEADVTIELKEKIKKMNETKSREASKEKSKKLKTEYSDSCRSDMIQVPASPEQSINQCTNGHVVPVGLIKTTGSIESNEFASSECILPDDDDDMHIVPHDLPALPKLQPAPGIALQVPSTPSNKPISASASTIVPSNSPVILNHLLSSEKTASEKPKHFIKISKGKIIVPTSVTSGNNSQSKVTPPPALPKLSNDTICLDSDEEETITPTVTPTLPVPRPNLTPVPVSVTVGHAPDLLTTSSNIAPVTAQGIPIKPLILRQVAGGSAPKFVLVPGTIDKAGAKGKAGTIDKIGAKDKAGTIDKVGAKDKVGTKDKVGAKDKAGTIDKVGTKGKAETKDKAGTINKAWTKDKAGTINKAWMKDKEETKDKAGMKEKAVTVEKVTPQSVQQKLSSKSTESILPTTTPSAACLNKIKQARCKPGDIIKISETGDIEVLQVNKIKSSSTKASNIDSKPKMGRNELAKSKASSDTEKPSTSQTNVVKSKPSYSELIKPKSSPSPISKSKPKKSTYSAYSDASKESENKQSKTRSLSISSSSSDSRPASPVDNNPLSILKNVVHIQAADDTPSSSTEYKTKPSRSQKSIDTNVSVQQIHSIDSKNSLKSFSSKVPTTQNKESISRTTKDGKSNSNANSLDKSSANKALNSVLSKKSLTIKSNKTPEKISSITTGSNVTPESKLASANNKIYHTVDLTQISKVTVGSGPSILKTKIEAKKRVSTAETSAPKKKKTELPTLKDFSLDDIDDIIELE